MQELRWYLEKFLDYPFDPETIHADRVQQALKAWGTQAFNALLNHRNAGSWFAAANELQVRSDDAGVLSWPWEALFDDQAGFHLAHGRRVERCLNGIPDARPTETLATLPRDRVNILLVVCRPFQRDVGFRSIARPLIDLIHSADLPAHVDVLRPPTFENLRRTLQAKPGFYHVLHFDGHGSFGSRSTPEFQSPHQLKAHQQGHLIFEKEDYTPDAKSAAQLTALLREHAVPAVVLNACQSAMLDAPDPFASVATALLKGGMRSVVAMSYSLYVSGAKVFLPAFYQCLFDQGSVAEAVRAGRQEMLARPERVCARGEFPLQDWLLPVLYQQAPLDFSFAQQAPREPHQSVLPPEVREYREPYGFVGRDRAILEMERARHRQAPAILLEGMGGVGKTTIARAFLRWLDQTGGLDGALWIDFRDIRSAESVIHQIGIPLFGDNFRLAENKFELLRRALSQRRIVIVWDNFESSDANLSPEDRAHLVGFLEAIYGCKSKVLITSRPLKDWLRDDLHCALPLGGLNGEERWEFCRIIAHELGIPLNRDNPDKQIVELMDLLAGHPLAMRVVLPKLRKMSAQEIVKALRTNISALGLNEQEEQGRLFATLRFVEEGLAPELRPLLPLVGLHEGYVDADHLEDMAKLVDPLWTRPLIDRLMQSLEAAGLLRDLGQATYEIHPLLVSYLRRDPAPEACERAFVDFMGSFAQEVGLKLHEQRLSFRIHGATFAFALMLAERLGLPHCSNL